MQREQAIEIIRGSALAAHADALISLLEPSARLVVHTGPAMGTGNPVDSHLGGAPSLPAGVSWPHWDRHDYLSAQIARHEDSFKKNPRATGLRDLAAQMRLQLSDGPSPLAFLGQLSLAQLQDVAPLPLWPHDGTLLFFYHASQNWGYDPLAKGHCRALYFSSELELNVQQAPPDIPGEAVFSERALSFVRDWTLPSRVDLGDDCFTIWDDELRELAGGLMPGLLNEEPIHRCGGYPQEIQGDMRLECQLVTNGIYCGDPTGYQDPRRSALEDGEDEWTLLIQIDSEPERLGWMWGDSGRVYFWVRRQELAAANFDGAWAMLQCY